MLSLKRSDLQPILRSLHGLHLTIYANNRGEISDLKEQLRNALALAEENLESELSREEMNNFLEPVRNLIHNPLLLQSLKGNLGVFRTRDTFRILSVPVTVSQATVIANSFHVKPLLRWMQMDRDFFLLALERGETHLYQGNHFQLRKIEIPRTISNSQGRNAANSELASSLTDWLNNWMTDFGDQCKPQLFITGEVDLVERAALTLHYPHQLRPEFIAKFSSQKLSEICFNIRRILRAESRSRTDDTILEFYQALTDRMAQSNLQKIAYAATQSRVSKLIIADGITIHGTLDAITGDLEIHAADSDRQDDDVLDDIAQLVLAKGGEVVVASRDQIPQGRPALAIIHGERSMPRHSLVVRDQRSYLQYSL